MRFRPQALATSTSTLPVTHDHYMRQALAEAEQALVENEVPVGAVIVHGERVIAAATTSGRCCTTRPPTPR